MEVVEVMEVTEMMKMIGDLVKDDYHLVLLFQDRSMICLLLQEDRPVQKGEGGLWEQKIKIKLLLPCLIMRG